MLEKDIEKDFLKVAPWYGYLCYKFKDPSRRDAPDVIALSPKRPPLFFEFKQPGKKPRPGQRAYHRALAKLGFSVFVVTSVAGAVAHLEDHARL